MKIASITSGAAGMFCGSCMLDNALVTALIAQGHDAVLLPTYTPIRTDEADVSDRRVFLGGINVYLDQVSGLARRLPRAARWLLDRPWLIRLASRLSPLPEYAALGELTVSMLRGTHGKQSAEVEQLVGWLAGELQPEIVTLSNVLISGLAPPLKKRLGVPVLAYLQGDDVLLDALHAEHRRQAIELIRANGEHLDGYVTACRDSADYMAEYFGLPRERIHVVYPGVNLKGHGGPREDSADGPLTVGYFARIDPNKGLHVLMEAYDRLRQRPGAPETQLRVGGWLGPNHKAYFNGLVQKYRPRWRPGEFIHEDAPDHASKARFLRRCDVLSVPTTYREPKGLYVLEALANGTPVVQPAHGSFPELVDMTGGGLLVAPNDPAALADGLHRLLTDGALRRTLGTRGQESVRGQFTADVMARMTVAIYQRYLN